MCHPKGGRHQLRPACLARWWVAGGPQLDVLLLLLLSGGAASPAGLPMIGRGAMGEDARVSPSNPHPLPHIVVCAHPGGRAGCAPPRTPAPPPDATGPAPAPGLAPLLLSAPLELPFPFELPFAGYSPGEPTALPHLPL